MRRNSWVKYIYAMDDIVGIHVKLRQSGSDKPLTGDEYSVKFYDKDLLKDDYLGVSTLDDHGQALISITQQDIRSNDSPLEKYPDIYFEVHRNDSAIYKSPVIKNIDVEKRGDFTTSGEFHCNLGTYNIHI